MIDLRSDTVTQPTPAMRQAIANAIVGDAVIDVDPTIRELELETAALLGKPAAVFMPSGTMTNQVALRVHCGRGTGFLCESNCHLVHYEQHAYAQLSGIVAHPVTGVDSILRVDDLQPHVRGVDDFGVATALVCLENTLNRGGGRVVDQADVDAVCDWSHSLGLRTHLDGARLWNAAVQSGVPLDRMVAGFDSVSVCFSKGLGAPVGSALAGEAAFIEDARRTRKLFGGAMRQAGILAAGALHALRHHRDRLQIDHDHARMIASVADTCESLSIRGGRVDTNIVIFEIDPDWGTAADMQRQLEDAGIATFAFDRQAIRLVTHLDVSGPQIEQTCQVLRRIAGRVPASP